MKSLIKPLLPRTLFGRSLMILVTPVILIQLVSTVVFIDRHWEKMTDRLAHAVAGEIVLLDEWLGESFSPEELELISAVAGRELDLSLHFEAGGDIVPDVVSGRDVSVVKETLSRALQDKTGRPYVIDVDVKNKRVHVTLQRATGTLHISVPQRRLFSSSGYIFLLWMSGISIFLLFIAILFMRNQIRPIRRLAIAADRFGKGQDIPPGFKPEGAREVRQAAKAFIKMQERIRKQMQQRTAMLAGVSHDLRTPLTRMKLQVSMLPPSDDTKALMSDIADMERMINAYLEFMRGEGGEDTSLSDVSVIVHRVAAKAQLDPTSIHIEIPADEDFSFDIRPIAFERCLSNIIGNAVKYADEVWITLERMQKSCRIIIDDNGPGIDLSSAEDLFKPFVRGEPSRNKNTGGVGLGLTIARDIIHNHGGHIKLDDSPKGGLRVLIIIPF